MRRARLRRARACGGAAPSRCASGQQIVVGRPARQPAQALLSLPRCPPVHGPGAPSCQCATRSRSSVGDAQFVHSWPYSWTAAPTLFVDGSPNPIRGRQPWPYSWPHSLAAGAMAKVWTLVYNEDRQKQFSCLTFASSARGTTPGIGSA